MSTLRVDNIRSRTGTAVSVTSGNSIIVGGGMTVTGDLTLSGSANLNAPSGIATFQKLDGALLGTFSGDTQVGGALTVVGNLTVDGTQTIVNTETLDVADKTVGVASTSAATDTTANGAGLEIYASSATANNNKTILWQKANNAFEYSDPIKVPGVQETTGSSEATGIQTYINGTSLVLEIDMELGTVFTYTSPAVAAASDAAGIGIVSFKNMPASSQNIQTVSIIHTQGKGNAGYGNTVATQGVGITCTVVPKANGSMVAGISTRAWCNGGIGAAATVTCSADNGTVSGNVDVISFLVHYTGATNTDLNSYKVYVSANKGFNQGGVGV